MSEAADVLRDTLGVAAGGHRDDVFALSDDPVERELGDRGALAGGKLDELVDGGLVLLVVVSRASCSALARVMPSSLRPRKVGSFPGGAQLLGSLAATAAAERARRRRTRADRAFHDTYT
jgi:hypothetical protein